MSRGVRFYFQYGRPDHLGKPGLMIGELNRVDIPGMGSLASLGAYAAGLQTGHIARDEVVEIDL